MYPLLVVLLSIVQSAVTIQKVDPLVKVFPESTAFRKAPDFEDAARGSHVEFQLALRSCFPVEELQISCSGLKMRQDMKSVRFATDSSAW